MKYKITLNKKTYEVEVEKGKAILAAEYDVVAAPAAEVAPAVAPVAAPVAAAAPAPAPVAAPAAPVAAVEGEKVTSQLPGTITAVKVAVGDAVSAGQVLVVIEAMKMENDMVAPCAGTVKQVAVKQGDSVESGALLVVLG